MSDSVFRKEYYYTVNFKDCYDNITPFGILNIFQDVASKHVEKEGYGFSELFKLGYFWILVRTKYEVIKYPKPTDEVLVAETWQTEQGRVDFNREYAIYSKDGEKLIIGDSKWCLIDVNTRRIAPTKVINNAIINNTKSNFSEPFKKLAFDPIISGNDYKEKVTFSKLDHNGHMNNAYYAELIVNAIRPSKSDLIKKFAIDYLKESIIDDLIVIKKKEEGNVVLIEGYRENDILFRAKIELF